MTKVSFSFAGVAVALVVVGGLALMQQQSAVDSPSSARARIRPRSTLALTKPREPEVQRVSQWPPVAREPVALRERPTPGVVDRVDDGDARTEAGLMSELRSLGPNDSERSLDLAREGNARFPTTAAAPERARIVVKSLVGLGRFHEARDEARRMVLAYPRTPEALDVERHLLVYPLDKPSREQTQANMRGDVELRGDPAE